MIVNLCRGLQQLPVAGGVLEQPVAMLRWLAIIAVAEGRETGPGDDGPDLARFQRIGA